jgi:hypothetical protein
MQLNDAQPTPLTALLRLNFSYLLQMVLVPPDAHLCCYSSVATTFYTTFGNMKSAGISGIKLGNI